jgi:hypothetical protein
MELTDGIERWNGSEIDEEVLRLAREGNIKFRNWN